MTTLQTIDYAINETIKKHPTFDLRNGLYGYLSDKVDLRVFTSSGGARQLMQEISKSKIIADILSYSIKIAIVYEHFYQRNRALAEMIPYASDYVKLKNAFDNSQNLYTFILTQPQLFQNIIKGFAQIRYYSDPKVKAVIENANILDKKANFESTCEKQGKFSNVRVNPQTVSRCRNDILRGSQIKNRHNEYALDGVLFAVNDVGTKRNNQEDSILISCHPQNSEFRILVVSDGMGGINGGEIASNYTLAHVICWFESLSPSYFEKEEELAQMFSEEIIRINRDFYDKYGNSPGRCPGATFTGAIVGKNKTIIGNVGDSRAYLSKDGALEQITRDDSLVQILYEQKEIINRDEMRFHESSNVVSQNIGLPDDICPRMNILRNSDYDFLMLFSDGITDCLSDEQIKFITKHTPQEKIAQVLVETAKSTDSYLDNPKPGYHNKIPAGKDNESAVVYAPRR